MSLRAVGEAISTIILETLRYAQGDMKVIYKINRPSRLRRAI